MYLEAQPTATLMTTQPLSSSPEVMVNVPGFGDDRSMPLIRDIVQQALATCYLSLEAEEQLRTMLKGKYDVVDLKAFMQLQSAVMKGKVRQEARERIQSNI